jgi:molecular chaperone GrpE
MKNSPKEEIPNVPVDLVEETPASETKPTPEMQVTQLQEKLLRVQADFDNYRKRITKEKEDSIRYSNENLLMELLPVVDNFELGLVAAETATDPKSIAMGMQMVKSQLKRFLEDCGVQEINAIGSMFDPHLHEAVSQEVSSSVPDGSILSQSRKGYKLRDRLLRPAVVVVAHVPAA